MPFDLDGFIEQQRDRLQLPVEQIRSKVVTHENVVNAILEEAEEYDLVVLGCTREPLLYQVGRETLPDTIARRCPKPLVMVKAPEGIKSWLKRWI